MMPEMDGFEVCQRFKLNKETKDIPIIFMTALSDLKDKVHGFKIGAVDYITKPLQYEEVIARVKTHVNLQNKTIELKKRNQESQDALHEAELANKAKNTFLANMSHELRTPLNAIMGYTDLIQDDAHEFGYDDIVPDLSKIHSAAGHLLNTIGGVLDYAKIEAEKIKIDPIDLSVQELIDELLVELDSAVKISNNKLNLTNTSGVEILHTDRKKLKQVLLNILLNATKFTSNGNIDFNIKRNQNNIVFVIIDTGVGIAKHHLISIFKPFAQVDSSYSRSYDGIGIGLSICNAYSRMLGGKIKVKSEPNKGSKFEIEIPINFGY
jgi:signal transduction histidine kinase